MLKAFNIELKWAISSVVERIVCIDEVADSISASSNRGKRYSPLTSIITFYKRVSVI